MHQNTLYLSGSCSLLWEIKHGQYFYMYYIIILLCIYKQKIKYALIFPFLYNGHITYVALQCVCVCVYVCVCVFSIYHRELLSATLQLWCSSLFNQSSTYGHSGCFSDLFFVNKCVMKTPLQMPHHSHAILILG